MNNDNRKNWKKWLGAAVGLLLSVGFTVLIIMAQKTPYTDYEEVSYNDFLDYLNMGAIDTIYYNAEAEWMYFSLYNDDSLTMSKEEKDKYTYPDEDMRKCLFPKTENWRESILLTDTNLEVYAKENQAMTVITALPSLVISLALIYVLFIYMNKMGIMTSPVDDVEKKSAENEDLGFKDVIGHDEVIGDLKFLLELMKNSDIANKHGVHIPRGILLSGEPGTGKTLIARALAGEAKMPFLYMNASSFVELYVGQGAKRVRELFKKAEKKAPCILFIDELDAVGIARSGDDNSERRQTLNALLQEMDGYNGNKGIFVLAATNNSEVLDKALVRAGRFDREVIINPPKDWQERLEILNYYLEKNTLADDVDLENFARQLVGFTGADIRTVTNEAAMISLNANNKIAQNPAITQANLEEALDKRMLKGNRSTKEAKAKERERVAYHESGHAIVTYVLGQPIARATICGTTSGVGGFVLATEKDDDSFIVQKDLEDKVRIAYAGRIAEEKRYGKGNTSTGASSDITQATNILTSYVMKYGFDENIGCLDLTVLANLKIDTERMAYDEIKRISAELYKECADLGEANWYKVELLAQTLLQKETMQGSEIEELLGGAKEEV